jgi:hypothetical protein
MQNDTVYVATSKGVRISRDGWASYDSVISDFSYNGVTQVSCIAATAGAVYAGTRSGFYLSSDNGRTFRPDSSLVNPLGGATVQCNAVATQNNVLYVGTGVGIYRSTDGGKSFSLGLFSNGLGAPVNRIYTTDSVVALASTYGLYLSPDAGVSYTVFRSQSGIGGGLLNNCVSVAVKGRTIYAGFFNNYLTILRPRS